MWTTIRSGSRTAFTVFAALLAAAVIVAVIVFAVQWIFPSHIHTYQSYTLEVAPSDPWHAGQSLSVLWVPSLAQTDSVAPPRTVTCNFWLYGPYDSVVAAQADEQGSTLGVNAPLSGSAPSRTLSTDVSTTAPPPLTYALPADLAPGYYVAEGFVSSADSSTGGPVTVTWVAEVTA